MYQRLSLRTGLKIHTIKSVRSWWGFDSDWSPRVSATRAQASSTLNRPSLSQFLSESKLRKSWTISPAWRTTKSQRFSSEKPMSYCKGIFLHNQDWPINLGANGVLTRGSKPYRVGKKERTFSVPTRPPAELNRGARILIHWFTCPALHGCHGCLIGLLLRLFRSGTRLACPQVKVTSVCGLILELVLAGEATLL